MTERENFTLLITTNGSGEIATWVRTMVRTIRASRPGWRIVVALMPYRHATGGEESVLNGIPGIAAVLTVKETKKLLLSRVWPRRLDFGRPDRGVLIFLGGDQFLAGLLAQKLGWPAAAYIQEVARWPKLFQLLFCPRAQVLARLKKAKVPEEKIIISGDLVTDAVWQNLNEALGWDGDQIEPAEMKAICRARLNMPRDKKIVVFMPGSSYSWYKYVTPELVKAGEIVLEELPQVEPYLLVSPFIPPADQTITSPPIRQNKAGRWQAGGGEQKGVNLASGPAPDLVAAADLLVTVPGTKTAEAAALGTPMVVFLPLNRPDLVPMDGLIGLIAGSRLLKLFWPALIAAAKYIKMLLALPNIYAGQEIVPELVGKLSGEVIARKVIQVLNDQEQLKLMRNKLPATMGQPGAAKKIVDALSRLNDV